MNTSGSEDESDDNNVSNNDRRRSRKSSSSNNNNSNRARPQRQFGTVSRATAVALIEEERAEAVGSGGPGPEEPESGEPGSGEPGPEEPRSGEPGPEEPRSGEPGSTEQRYSLLSLQRGWVFGLVNEKVTWSGQMCLVSYITSHYISHNTI